MTTAVRSGAGAGRAMPGDVTQTHPEAGGVSSRLATRADARTRASEPSGSRSGSNTHTCRPAIDPVRGRSSVVSCADVEAARVRRVDRRHHGGVEHVDVEVDPVAVQLGRADHASYPVDRLVGMGRDLRGGDHVGDEGGDLGQVIVVVATADVDRVLRSEVRRQAVDRAHLRPMQTHGGREVLAGEGVAGRIVARVTEVGVAVDVDQPVATLAGAGADRHRRAARSRRRAPVPDAPPHGPRRAGRPGRVRG